LALKYFKLNTSKFKLDPKRIGLWGYSSGGHIVSDYALKHAQDPEEKFRP
jgi:acetyl esterase/lipase